MWNDSAVRHVSAVCHNPGGWRQSAFDWMYESLNRASGTENQEIMRNTTIWGALPRPGHTQFSHIPKQSGSQRKEKINNVAQCCPSSLNFKITLVLTDVNTYKY